MLRLIYLLSRRSDLTQAEFNDHWGGHHVAVHGQPVTALRRYVRYEAEQPEPGDFSGAVSVWCDDEDALTTAMSGAMEAASRDELRFIDHPRSSAFVVDDEVIEEPAWDSTVVGFECLTLDQVGDGDPAEAARALLAEPRTETLLKGLVISRPRPQAAATSSFESIGTPEHAFDAVIGYYFDSLLAARLLFSEQRSVGDRLGTSVTGRRLLPATRRVAIRDVVR